MDQYSDIEIRDESTRSEKRFQFYIKGCRRGLVTKKRGEHVKFHWQTAGPSHIEEARVWLQGLLELNVIAEQLESEAGHGKKTSRAK